MVALYHESTHRLTLNTTCLEAVRYYGNGNLVKSVLGDVVTYYIGKHYEKTVGGSKQNERKYYFAGTNRIAMRTGSGVDASGVNYLLSDHLGSTSVFTDGVGALVSKQLYKPFGETRYTNVALPTTYQYTGQRNESAIELYDYGARWYAPYLNRSKN